MRASSAPKLFLAALMVVGAGFASQLGWAWAQTSELFLVKAVELVGNERATEGELLRLAGLGEPQNLLQLDVAALERTLTSHPWVSAVRVTRRLPSRLTVEVTEHVATAVVSLGDLYLVDASGVPFKRLQPQDELDLPLITGLDRERYTERPLEARQRIEGALEVLRQWSRAPSEVRVSPYGLTVVEADGTEVRVGDGDLPAKLRRLARVRKELESRRLAAQLIRLDNRMRPEWVTVQLSAARGGAPPRRR